jgi:hypothetical protein
MSTAAALVVAAEVIATQRCCYEKQMLVYKISLSKRIQRTNGADRIIAYLILKRIIAYPTTPLLAGYHLSILKNPAFLVLPGNLPG